MIGTVAWGVVGSGGIARRRTIPEGLMPAAHARLAVVFDVDQERNTAVADEFGVAAAAGLDDLLEQPIDAVYVATPVADHLPIVVAAAERGKHVLCEKPLGRDVDEARRIVGVCADANVKLGTGLLMRFHAQHQAAAEMIHAGRLGQPVFARAQLSCWYPPLEGAWRQDPGRAGGGSLMDMGSHCIDLLEMFFGPVDRVSCFTNRSVHGYASEDSAVVVLWFANGALGTVDTFYCIPDEASQNRLELYGTGGSILATRTLGQEPAGEMLAFLSDDSRGYDAVQSREGRAAFSIDPHPVNLYGAEIEEFSLAVLEGRDPPIGGLLGLRNQRLLAACYESAGRGQAIDLAAADVLERGPGPMVSKVSS